MYKFTCCALAAAFLAFGAVAEETDHPWQFNDADRTGKYAPVASVIAEKTTEAAWTYPAWIEAFVSGIVPFGTIFIMR